MEEGKQTNSSIYNNAKAQQKPKNCIIQIFLNDISTFLNLFLFPNKIAVSNDVVNYNCIRKLNPTTVLSKRQ